jgi:dCTP deaminase
VGVLGNLELLRALEEGRIAISPLPGPPPTAASSPFGTTALDLRLSDQLRVPTKGLSVSFDLRRGRIGTTLDHLFAEETIGLAGYSLEPNQFILGRTIERVSLPLEGRLAARIEGRSSYARTGLLVHFTAPTIHAGFEGTITLEMINLGPFPIQLFPELFICQLIVETVDGAIALQPSQFQGQQTPSGA